MRSIVKFLYSSELGFPGTWEEEASFGRLSESVQRLAEDLHAAQPELWAEYQKQAEALRELEYWTEFEWGFLMAARLMAEVMQKTPEA